MSSNSKRVQFLIDATDNASSKFKQVQNSASKLSSSAKDAGASINGYGAVFGSVANGIMSAAKLTVGGITAIGVTAGLITKSTVSAFIQMESAMTGLSSVAKAFNQDVDATNSAARELARDGLMSVSDAAAGLKNLIASRFELPEAVRLMNALKDSASFNRQGFLSFGEAIKGATEGIKNGNSILVDNAGITKNLSVILTEAGFSAQDLQRATTDTTVRTAIFNGILKESAAFAGDAARASETMGGKVSKAGTSFFEFKALIGEGLAPVVGGLIDRFRGMLDTLTYIDDQGVKRLTPSVQALIEKLAELGGRVISGLIDNLGGWIDKMGGADGIYNKLKEVWDILNNDVIPVIVAFGKIVATVFKAVMFVVGSLRDYFEEKFYNMFVIIYMFQNLCSSFTKAVSGFFKNMGDAIRLNFDGAINWVIEKIKGAIDWVNRLIAGYNKFASVKGNPLPTIPEIRYRAAGGPVDSNMPYIVGERGPELFVPSNRGSIVPNNKLGGSTFNFTFNGDISDSGKLVEQIQRAVSRQLELSQYGIG